MRKVVSHTILTLDGVAVFDAVADQIVGLRDSEEVLSSFFEEVDGEDAMLLGRVTYQEWAKYWPNVSADRFARHINSIPKFVMSRTLETAPWAAHDDANLLSGELADEITELKDRPGKSIGVHGSPTLVESLLHADLLDEMRLEIYPVVAGAGGRLFANEHKPKRLRLKSSLTTESGVAILTYERG